MDVYNLLSDDENEDVDDDEEVQALPLTLDVKKEMEPYFKFVITVSEIISCTENKEFCVLRFWKEFGSKKYPAVARVARSILCIPASSAKSESNFSDASDTFSKKRTQLKSSKVDDLLFIRSNKDLI